MTRCLWHRLSLFRLDWNGLVWLRRNLWLWRGTGLWIGYWLGRGLRLELGLSLVQSMVGAVERLLSGLFPLRLWRRRRLECVWPLGQQRGDGRARGLGQSLDGQCRPRRCGRLL